MRRCIIRQTALALCPLAFCLGASAHAETLLRGVERLTPSASLRIMGGEEAAEGAWPWQVYIQVPLLVKGEKRSASCGGSVIAPRWVLSAAHCFVHSGDMTTDNSRSTMVIEGLKRVHPGSDQKPEFLASHSVSEIIVHPGYNPKTSENDIALMHMRESAQVASIAPLLTSDLDLEAPGAHAIVTGWGRLKEVEQQNDSLLDAVTHQPVTLAEVMPEHLMQVEMPLVDVEQCSAANHQSPNVSGVIDQRNLCAGVPEGGKDSCQGDSGGPLVASRDGKSFKQIGVVSWGVGCGRVGFPGIYTRVSAFAPWIKSVVGRDLEVVDAAPPPAPPPEPAPNPGFDNSAGVAINFDKGDHVRLGDRVAYSVSTRKAGYLAIFDATPDGKLTQIFPNDRSLAGAGVRGTRLTPERPLLVPNYQNPYRGFDVQVTGERGKGAMVAVLSDEPLTSLEQPSAPKTFGAKEGHSMLDRLQRELIRDLTVQSSSGAGGARGGAKPGWSVDIREYTVE